ncbi:MAG: DUF1273 family protein [Clostridia bacterium]|nr:DUF1273 family protein [Clostridia bacterium]
MSELFINRARACAFTGHRKLTEDFSIDKLKQTIERLIEGGFNTFLVGMALGFDTECFKVLEGIREKKEIKIIACIPCESQADRFSLKNKKEWQRMIDSADERVYISKEYTATCMQKRNEYMVDNCSVLVSFLRQEKSGTANTVKYAVKKQVMIIKL